MKTFFGTALILIIAAASSAYLALEKLDSTDREVRKALDPDYEVLYIPSGPALSFISFGYPNVVSNLLWFKTVSYFGKHYATDKNFKWLSHMCRVVTTLNPREEHVFTFCANMLSWEAESPEESVALLGAGIEANPASWSLRYLRGFTYYFFLKDPEKAKADFVAAAQLPDAHLLVKRLATKSLGAKEDLETTIEFLRNMLVQEKDPTAHKALEDRLVEKLIERDVATLNRGLEFYESREGKRALSLTDLVSAGIIHELPHDPLGRPYILDKSTGLAAASRQTRRR